MTLISEKHPPLERYFRILEILCGFSEGLTLSELTAILALPKASTHRLLAAMQKSNLVAQSSPGGTYVLTQRVRRLAQLSAGQDFIGTMTSSLLQQLVDETGETCYLARLEGAKVRTIVMESPNAPWRGFVLPGKLMHPHATASGKAILAFQPDEVVNQALDSELPKFTQHTHTSRKDILADYARIRKNGFATCIREVDEGLAAVAVPVSVDAASVIYALGIVGPLPRIQALLDAEIVPRLKKSSNAISALLSKGGASLNL